MIKQKLESLNTSAPPGTKGPLRNRRITFADYIEDEDEAADASELQFLSLQQFVNLFSDPNERENIYQAVYNVMPLLRQTTKKLQAVEKANCINHDRAEGAGLAKEDLQEEYGNAVSALRAMEGDPGDLARHKADHDYYRNELRKPKADVETLYPDLNPLSPPTRKPPSHPTP